LAASFSPAEFFYSILFFSFFFPFKKKEDAQTNTDETGSTFLYNNWISLPGLPARLNFGQGLAMVSIIPHYGQASLTQVRSVEFNDVQTREIVDGVEQGPPVSPSSMSLDLHLWIRGQIKEEALLEHITTIANQTVAEFLLETDLGVSADSLAVPTIGPFVADCAKVFARAAGFASSAVKVINTTTQVPAWAIHNILLEIEESVRFVIRWRDNLSPYSLIIVKSICLQRFIPATLPEPLCSPQARRLGGWAKRAAIRDSPKRRLSTICRN
jgi:hypothetical protein